jgi:hypothetical protein
MLGVRRLLIGVSLLTLFAGCTSKASEPAQNKIVDISDHVYGTSELQNQLPQPVFSEFYASTVEEPLASIPPQSIAQASNQAPYIRGQDGAFLGVVSNNRVAENSVCNRVGNYGSQVSQMSIRFRVGNYGSRISDFSAYNPNAQRPPEIIENGQAVAFLTKNRRLEYGLDPDAFFYELCGQ